MLLVLGRFDFLVPHTSWDGVDPRPPQLTTHTFDRSAHTPFFEEPERFRQVLEDWLAENDC